MCYRCSMKGKRRRPGATETFSVSVDVDTKRALKALADADFGGNVSAAVTDLAADARRRLAAGQYLRERGHRPMSPAELDALEAALGAEVRAKKGKRRGAAA